MLRPITTLIILLFTSQGVFSQEDPKLQNLWNHQSNGRSKVLAVTADSVEVRLTDLGKASLRTIKPLSIASRTEIPGGVRLALKQDSASVIQYLVIDFKGINKDSVQVTEYPFVFETIEQCGKLTTGLSEFPSLSYHTTEYLNYRKQGEKAATLKKEDLLGLFKTITDELRDSTARKEARKIQGSTTDERLINYCLNRIKKEPFAKKIYPQNFSVAYKKFKDDPAVQKQLIPLKSVFFVKPVAPKVGKPDAKKNATSAQKTKNP